MCIFGVAGVSMVLLSLLGPWIVQSSDPKFTFDSLMKEYVVNHGRFLRISPLRIWVIEDDSLTTSIWLYDFGTSLTAVGLIVGSILCSLRFRWKISSFGFSLWAGCGLLFFMSFGRSLDIGMSTQLGWGVHAAIISGILLLISTLAGWLTSE